MKKEKFFVWSLYLVGACLLASVADTLFDFVKIIAGTVAIETAYPLVRKDVENKLRGK